jgi:hypothetical protein
MGRQKMAQVVPVDTSNVTPASITKETFPEGTPTNVDGTVVAKAELTVQEVRKIGAADAESAAQNKRVAKTVAKKLNGEKVSWGTDNAIEMFDVVAQTCSSSSVYIYVSQVHPELITFQPMRMDAFRTNAEMYDYILNNIHKNKDQARYEVLFRDTFTKQQVGKAHLTMPSTRNNDDPRGNTMNHGYGPHGYPPPPYVAGYPQAPAPGYGYPAPPPVQPYYPNPGPPMPPPVQAAPPMAAVAPTPTPGPQLPLGTDPALLQILHLIQGQMHNQEVQLAGALGAIDEFKRLEATRQAYPQASQPVPQPSAPPQFHGAPFGTQAVYDAAGHFLGYLPASQGSGAPVAGAPPPPPPPQPRGFGAPPPPPPTQSLPNVQVAQTMQLDEMLGKVSALLSNVDKFRSAIGGNVTPGGEEEDDGVGQTALAAVPKPDDPFHTTRLGFTDEAPVLVTDKDGKINVLGSVLGNAGHLSKMLQGIANGLTSVAQANQRLNQQRPITGVGTVIEQPVQRALPPGPPQPQVMQRPITQPQAQLVQAPAPPPPPPAPRLNLDIVG